MLDCYQAALVWHQQLAFPLSLQFSHCWLQLGGNSEYQGWGLYKGSKGLEVKWPTQLILGAMGYASRYSRPLASCCFSLRIQAAFMLIPWESWGKEGTAVECWGAGAGDPANSQLLSARALVARSRNSAVPVPASREAAVRGAIQPREWLQLWVGAPSLSEQREGAEACWIVMLTELLLLPPLPWEATAAMVRQSCFPALWLIDRKLQVLSLSNWFTCQRMLG